MSLLIYAAAAALFAAPPAPAVPPATEPAEAKLEELSPVVERLVGEMFASTPETWDFGILTIQSDGVRLTYQLKNETSPDRAVLTPGLVQAIDELYVRMRDNGHAWTAARFEFRKEGDDVKFTSSFDYEGD